MLAIETVITTRPRLLMLGEPSSGPARQLVEGLSEAVKRLRREAGTTPVIAEQTVPKLLELSDRAYILVKGRVVREGAPADRGEDVLRAVYLGATPGGAQTTEEDGR